MSCAMIERDFLKALGIALLFRKIALLLIIGLADACFGRFSEIMFFISY